MKLIKQVERFVKRSIKNRVIIKHHKRTLHYLLKLYPKADEALQIAALSHDIERFFRKKGIFYGESGKAIPNKRAREQHGRRSGECMAKFLKEQDADIKLINKVKKLLKAHEDGGFREANFLKDADSISFLENNFNYYFKLRGKKRTNEKLDYMFNRITFRKAKELAKPFYKKCKKKLEKLT